MARHNKWTLITMLTTLFLGGVGFVYLEWRYSSVLPVLPPSHTHPVANKENIAPLPITLSVDKRKVSLGDRLFNDPRLSGNGYVSCAHCHNLETGGVDHLRYSRGIDGKEGVINAPTVFNSGFNFRQFWDGRAETLEDQIDGPLLNPNEMASNWPQVIATISKDQKYNAIFSSLYRDGVQPANVKDAIATFERSLITPNSRFDRFLRGDQSALNEKEKNGYRLFKEIGCTSCHQGINIGGNMYQKLGMMEDYFSVRGNIIDSDLGRFNVTHQEKDRYFFKVPSLRNVAVTSPYLHDGSVKTLGEAVKIMARYQLGSKLTDSEVTNIVAFLHSLTGEYMGKPLQ